MLINTNKKYLFFILKDILKIKIKETLPFTLRFLCVLDTLQNLLLSSPYRTNAVSEVKLFVILAAFGLLHATESSVLGAVRILHVFRHFIINIVVVVIIIIIIIFIIIIIIIIIELTHSKTILEITVEIEPQPAALDFKNLSQYSSRSKQNCLLNLCCSNCNTNLLQSITKLFGYST